MLSKKRRLPREIFDEASKRGRAYHSNMCTCRVFSGVPPTEASRFSVVISKKMAARAVDRTRARRRIYDALAQSAPKQGLHAIVWLKKPLVDLPFSALVTYFSDFFRSPIGNK